METCNIIKKIWEAALASDIGKSGKSGLVAAEIAAKALTAVANYSDDKLDITRDQMAEKVIAIMQEMVDGGGFYET